MSASARQCLCVCSLHGHFRAVASKDLVGHNDFLLTPPPVLMSPNISPVQKVGHWEHGDGESADEWLSADNWEECVSCC